MLRLICLQLPCSLLATSLILGCSAEPDFQPYRKKVAQELRDPDSAIFRSEKVRTLWTKGGKRMTIYCAEVNSNNAFGGKTGFMPVRYFIDERGMGNGSLGSLKGEVFIQTGMSSNLYLDCVREDTERNHEAFGKAFVDLDGFNKAVADRAEPVLSEDLAPELR